MSLWSTVNKGLDMARVCTTAIEVIGALVKNRPSLDTLDLIGKIVDRVQAVLSGKEDPAEAKKYFETLKSDISSNNDAVDADIDEKFDKT